MATFFMKKTPAGVKFDLKEDGVVIATSEVYTTEATCKKGIESTRNSSSGDVEDQTKEGFAVKTHPKFEVYNDKSGAFRYRLKARNGQIVAISNSGVDSLEKVLALVNAVKAGAAGAEIDSSGLAE